jgi:poly-beta-1,6-N-acetyl-D-glucosamine synthase
MTAVWVFGAAAAFLVYAIAGYPVLLACVAGRRPRPLVRDKRPRNVTVLLCVYNGEKWIRQKLASIAALRYPREYVDVLVVSDGSTDGTEAAVREFSGVRLLRVPHAGKPAALNAGMAAATGEIVFFTDVRQPLDPDCLTHLVSCFGDPSVAGATGQLVFLDEQHMQPVDFGLYWRYELWIRENLSRLDSLLTATGCVYAMRRSLLAPLPHNILVDDFYQPMRAILRGYRLVFEQRAIAYEYSTALDAEFRRKVRTLAGIYQLAHAFPALLLPFRRMGLHFVSYKLARVAMPFALLTMAAASFYLPAPWAVPAMAAQLLFYLLAIVDRWIPNGSIWKRISSPARTFTVLMAAALVAMCILFVPAGRLWKEPTQVNRTAACS